MNPCIFEEAPVAEYNFTVLFEPAEEGGFMVTCLALPSLVTEDDTLEEARAMAPDAIRGYIESLQKDRLPIPSDKTVKEEISELVPSLSKRKSGTSMIETGAKLLYLTRRK